MLRVCVCLIPTQNQAITYEHKLREQRSGSAGERGAEKRKNRNKTKALVIHHLGRCDSCTYGQVPGAEEGAGARGHVAQTAAAGVAGRLHVRQSWSCSWTGWHSGEGRV